MPGWRSSVDSGTLTSMPSNATSIAWINHKRRVGRQRGRRQTRDHAAQTANVTKEKPNENQADQRIRGRSGQGPALLYRGAGFRREKADFSNGPYRWLTVASPEEPDGTELRLALNNNPAAKAYQH